MFCSIYTSHVIGCWSEITRMCKHPTCAHSHCFTNVPTHTCIVVNFPPEGCACPSRMPVARSSKRYFGAYCYPFLVRSVARSSKWYFGAPMLVFFWREWEGSEPQDPGLADVLDRQSPGLHWGQPQHWGYSSEWVQLRYHPLPAHTTVYSPTMDQLLTPIREFWNFLTDVQHPLKRGIHGPLNWLFFLEQVSKQSWSCWLSSQSCSRWRQLVFLPWIPEERTCTKSANPHRRTSLTGLKAMASHESTVSLFNRAIFPKSTAGEQTQNKENCEWLPPGQLINSLPITGHLDLILGTGESGANPVRDRGTAAKFISNLQDSKK